MGSGFTGAWPRTFRLALLDKDVGIALGVAGEADVDTPVLSAARAALQAARAVLGEEADYLEAIRVTERQAGVEIRG